MTPRREPRPQYGEPWREVDGAIYSADGELFLVAAEGCTRVEVAKRAVECVNRLAGWDEQDFAALDSMSEPD